jgi:hypothetical protein
VPCHTFATDAIRWFLRFTLDAACSLRGAGAVMGLLQGRLPELDRAPAEGTGQLWLLRLGLYELQRPKEVANDWVWIMDHTVQIGTTKCLVIVGVRLSAWRAEERPLELRDLSAFEVTVVEKSDGAAVQAQLEETSCRTGIVPRAIVSDEGTDLKGGIEAFCQKHPETLRVLDIAHQAAKLLKQELEADERWAEYYRQAGGAKQRLAQTPLAHLLPPTPRNKARYMNLGPLVKWGRRVLHYLENPAPVAGVAPDPAALEAKLGWVADYREALEEWLPALRVISIVKDYVGKHGYHRGARAALRKRLADGPSSPMSQRLADRLSAFVARQSAQAKRGERLVGSSECLESLIGKGKRLQGQQSKSGFTRIVLGMAAAVAKLTNENVTQALSHVRTRDVTAWCQHHLGVSVQSQRRLAFASGTKMG